jgi:hypothetical protein
LHKRAITGLILPTSAENKMKRAVRKTNLDYF